MSVLCLVWALVVAVWWVGCVVCAFLRADEDRYWDGFLYERFQAPDASRSLRATVGYCLRHARQLEERRDVVPGAKMALAAVRGALDRLEDPPPGRRPWRRGEPRLPAPGAGCPVCVRLAGTQRDALSELAVQLERDPDLARDYARSDGLCVDHLQDVRGNEALAAPTRRALGALAEALERLLDSFDYRNAPADPELVDAWRRAFRLIRGDPGAVRA